MTLQDTILALCDLPGPAGYEEPVAALCKKLLEPYVDQVTTDVLGNVIGVRRCGKKNAKKLLLDAHIDEVGLIITGHEDGFLRFSALGGVDARMLPASEIKILTDPPVTGVIGVLSPHLLRGDESDKTIKTEDLFIDIGLDQEAAKKAVPLGTPAVFNTAPRVFGDGLICAKGLDDRVCFAALVRALELLKDKPLEVDLYILGSVQEELGTRGAKAAAFDIRPDWAVAVDVDYASSPDAKEHWLKSIGGGAVISKGPILNRRLTDLAAALAQERGIKYQIGVEAGDTGTNARVINLPGAGVATALLDIPLRYMHSPVEVVSVQDAEATAQLLAAVAESLKGESADA
jgi:endoglucanase